MARKSQSQPPQPRVDLNDLLHGSPVWADVVDYWQKGTFDDECYLVEAIKKHLRTPAQKALLDGADVSIEDMLNGRNDGRTAVLVQSLFDAWNQRLGFRAFGF